MAKDRFGELVPYHPPFHLGPEEGTSPARRWRDGSLESDLPMIQLKELFNVNHFIVSQANPHIAPFLRLKEFVRAHGGNFAAKLAHLAEMEVKHRCNQVLELGFPLGGIAKLFAQAWEGDVTVVMPATLAQYSKIIQNPSYGELQKAANQGRRCTWEKLSAIKSNCGIELALASQSHSHSNNHNLPSTGRFNASRRIPSWNCIARENSTGSLEDEALADVSTFQQASGTSTAAGASSRHHRSTRNVQDLSDSETESVDLHTWTRSGGPLMRTISADMFVDFVQNLDLDVEAKQSLTGHLNSGGLSNPSITVTEGDYLQPESIPSGIVFNIVKKEDLTVSGRSYDSESLPSPAPDCVQLERSERGIDVSSESDSDDSDNHNVVDKHSGIEGGNGDVKFEGSTKT